MHTINTTDRHVFGGAQKVRMRKKLFVNASFSSCKRTSSSSMSKYILLRVQKIQNIRQLGLLFQFHKEKLLHQIIWESSLGGDAWLWVEEN